MDPKVEELQDRLLELLKEYYSIFHFEDISQILNTVNNIVKSSAIKTIDEKNKKWEKILPKRLHNELQVF